MRKISDNTFQAKNALLFIFMIVITRTSVIKNQCTIGFLRKMVLGDIANLQFQQPLTLSNSFDLA
jgi:hypothetical protein